MITMIRRICSACLLALAVFLLIIIGAGGMLLDLLGAAASALVCMATTEIYINVMENDEEDK